MAEIALYNIDGEKVGEVAASDALLDAPANEALVHQALVDVDRACRLYAGKTKTHSEVTGTTAKWFRQKGTGRARHGSREAAQFVGGYKAHGPKPRPAKARMPKRMRRAAMCGALSGKRRQGRLTLLDEFVLDEISTADFVQVMDNLEATGRVLVVVGPTEDAGRAVYLSGRNVRGVTVRRAPHLSVRDLLGADRVILTRASVGTLEETWC